MPPVRDRRDGSFRPGGLGDTSVLAAAAGAAGRPGRRGRRRAARPGRARRAPAHRPGGARTPPVPPRPGRLRARGRAHRLLRRHRRRPLTGRGTADRTRHVRPAGLRRAGVPGVALAATMIQVAIGVAAGVAAALGNRWVDQLLSRATDVIVSMPLMIMALALLAIVPSSFPRPVLVTLVIGLIGWGTIAKIVRAQTLSLKGLDYVSAARLSGWGTWRVARRELLPGLAAPVITYAALLVPTNISVEAALSFLGVGVKPPTPSWGQMLTAADVWYQAAPPVPAAARRCPVRHRSRPDRPRRRRAHRARPARRLPPARVGTGRKEAAAQKGAALGLQQPRVRRNREGGVRMSGFGGFLLRHAAGTVVTLLAISVIVYVVFYVHPGQRRPDHLRPALLTGTGAPGRRAAEAGRPPLRALLALPPGTLRRTGLLHGHLGGALRRALPGAVVPDRSAGPGHHPGEAAGERVARPRRHGAVAPARHRHRGAVRVATRPALRARADRRHPRGHGHARLRHRPRADDRRLRRTATAALPAVRELLGRPRAMGVEPPAALALARPDRGGLLRPPHPRGHAGDPRRGPHPHLPRVRRRRAFRRRPARPARRPGARDRPERQQRRLRHRRRRAHRDPVRACPASARNWCTRSRSSTCRWSSAWSW